MIVRILQLIISLNNKNIDFSIHKFTKILKLLNACLFYKHVIKNNYIMSTIEQKDKYFINNLSWICVPKICDDVIIFDISSVNGEISMVGDKYAQHNTGIEFAHNDIKYELKLEGSFNNSSFGELLIINLCACLTVKHLKNTYPIDTRKILILEPSYSNIKFKTDCSVSTSSMFINSCNSEALPNDGAILKHVLMNSMRNPECITPVKNVKQCKI
jgi:hypothetical protein